MEFLPLTAVRMDDAEWSARQALVRDTVLPYQWEILNDNVPGAEKSHCIENFRIAAGDTRGEHYGVVFLDSDLYKWLEAVGHLLSFDDAPDLRARAEEAIALIGRAQMADGYIDTWYQLKNPKGRWVNLMEGHELYCAGHLIEAAVAWARGAKDDSLLKIAVRFADHIDKVFGASGRAGCPGHPEIELALLSLYDLTKEEKYLNLAARFIDLRGGTPSLFDGEAENPDYQPVYAGMRDSDLEYFQAHTPVRAQTVATGHAVRAMYLYAAMAQLSRETGDAALQQACERLFEDVVKRQMYVTGGVGSAAGGERFTTDFDLPSDTAYCETCASVGLMRFARRMWLLTGDKACFDVWERALQNTVLAGMGRDGRHFFYVNPLSVVPKTIRENPGLSHVLCTRPEWFGVACCPPNAARCLLSLQGSLYAMDGDAFDVLFAVGSRFDFGGVKGRMTRDKDACALTLSGDARVLRVRVPEHTAFSADFAYALKDGFAEFAHSGGERTYAFTLAPQVAVLRADPRVAALSGQACVMRGETVYCAEEADNGAFLSELRLPLGADFAVQADGSLSVPAYRAEPDGALYSENPEILRPVTLRLIPYRDWANSGEGEMRVWLCALCAT